jgi:hypothetical protein
VIEKIRNTTVDQLQEVARTYFKSETLALACSEISTASTSIARA